MQNTRPNLATFVEAIARLCEALILRESQHPSPARPDSGPTLAEHVNEKKDDVLATLHTLLDSPIPSVCEDAERFRFLERITTNREGGRYPDAPNNVAWQAVVDWTDRGGQTTWRALVDELRATMPTEENR